MDCAKICSEFLISKILHPMGFSEWDPCELVRASQRLIICTNNLNLDDLDKSAPFNSYPFTYDFIKLKTQIHEVRRIYEGYGLDHRFNNSLFRKMEVLATQLVPCSNAYVAYCELKSQLCLDENDFFFELYTAVESKIKAASFEDEKEYLMDLISRIRDVYDPYL